MTRESSILCLKKLYVLLNNLMGSTILGSKYTKSLKKAINSLERNKLMVENKIFKVKIENNIDNITIDVLSHNDDLIDSIRYDCDSFISEEIAGKS